MKHIFNVFFDRIFVISMENAKERFNKLKSFLDKEGIEFELWPGYDRTMVENYFIENNLNTKKINVGSGCTTAHFSCYMHSMHEGYSKILVLEDDAVFCDDNYIENFQKSIKDLPENWGYLKLGYSLSRQMYASEKDSIKIISNNLFTINKSAQTTAVALNLENISHDDDLKYVFTDLRLLTESRHVHIDHKIYNRCNDKKVAQYHCYPLMISQDNGYSYIENKERNQDILKKRTQKFTEEIFTNQKIKSLF
jgi:GR25 family glycosyltransferase involved in LPS biosynthesis